MPVFICPNCRERTVDVDGYEGFTTNVPQCRNCGFGFLFQLLEDYYPAPSTGFVVCDRDMTIIAIVDAKEPDQVIDPRDQKLETIKQRCLQAAQVKYICIYPPQLPRYRELREQILGPAGDLV